MYEALVDDHGRWLPSPSDARVARVAASQRPESVIYQPWVDAAVSAVAVRIEHLDDSGSALTISAYVGEPAPSADRTQEVRHRLGTAFGSALRDWVDQPHGEEP
jgi:hypothetical protein